MLIIFNFRVTEITNYTICLILEALLNNGKRMQVHETKHKIKASITAALPKSFARLERS